MTQTGEIIQASPAPYYRNMRFLMAAVIVGMGLWFAYDGWYAWPQGNIEHAAKAKKLEELVTQRAALEGKTSPEEKAKYDELAKEHTTVSAELKGMKAHSDWDIGLQRGLGFGLPPLGLALLIWALYNSRGVIRLQNDVLHVPGHPPIPLSSVTNLDNVLWDRKGIAYVIYNINGNTGRARLDDFIYVRKPVDQIYDIIVARLASVGGESAVTSPAV